MKPTPVDPQQMQAFCRKAFASLPEEFRSHLICDTPDPNTFLIRLADGQHGPEGEPDELRVIYWPSQGELKRQWNLAADPVPGHGLDVNEPVITIRGNSGSDWAAIRANFFPVTYTQFLRDGIFVLLLKTGLVVKDDAGRFVRTSDGQLLDVPMV